MVERKLGKKVSKVFASFFSYREQGVSLLFAFSSFCPKTWAFLQNNFRIRMSILIPGVLLAGVNRMHLGLPGGVTFRTISFIFPVFLPDPSL